jgi:DNA polymerase bacteriophage-type
VTPAVATFDFETFSQAGFVWVEPNEKKALGHWTCLPNAPQSKKGISVVGASVYTEHPTTEVLTLSFDLADGRGLERWRPGMPLPLRLFAHLAAGRAIEAHNAMFERLVWENVCVSRYGFPPLNPYQLRCSMATARVNNFPGGLANLGDVLGLDVRKDRDGKRLLDKFSVPRNPTKADARRRILPEHDPADAERLYEYCNQDVRTEQSAADRMAPMSDDELTFWLVDQEINHRGLGVDRAAVRDCIAVLEQALEQYGEECRAITNGLAPGQLAEIRGWLAAQGVHVPDMQADTVEMALKRPTMPAAARRVLEIRSLIGSASVKKLYAMEYQCSRDDRLRNLIVHHGARTGRPTGEGPQPLNLPKAGPGLVWCGACERPHKPDVDACPWCGVPQPPITRKAKWQAAMVPHVLEIMAARSLALVEWYFGDALLAIQGCVRGLFVAAPGHDLIASDYSAIEAVGAAMCAGETWRIDTLRARKDIYLASASQITGVPYDTYVAYAAEHGDHHPDRQKVGKIAELALGYGGWEGAWRAFDPDADSKSEADITRIIRAWRDASPQIVAMWGGQRTRDPAAGYWYDCLYGIEGAVIAAIRSPGTYHTPQPPRGVAPFPVELGFWMAPDADGTPTLFMRLPSGRLIRYREPEVEPSTKRPGQLAISYMTWNSNPKYGALGWVRMPTWGSRIFENAVQAICHDVLRFAILALRAAGYPTVLHVYDEIVVEVPEGLGSVEEVERIMATMPPWAAGWPIRAAGGWRGKRYRKG